MAGHVLDGKTDSPAAANSVETDGLARFAVEEHNKREVRRSGPRFSSFFPTRVVLFFC